VNFKDGRVPLPQISSKNRMKKEAIKTSLWAKLIQICSPTGKLEDRE
jgi:hypothetical protein